MTLVLSDSPGLFQEASHGTRALRSGERIFRRICLIYCGLKHTTRWILSIAVALPLGAAVPEFEPNLGQAEARFRYLARAPHSRILIEDQALQFRGAPDSNQPAVRLEWLGALTASPGSTVQWKTAHPTGNFFRYCNQPQLSLCDREIPTFRGVERTGLYRDIDWILHGASDGRFEYDLAVKPGGDPRQLRFRISGAPASIDSNGNLNAGPVLQRRPEASQSIAGRKVPVDVELLRIGQNEFTFQLGAYDLSVELVIDPVVEIFETSGGAGDDITIGAGPDFRYGTTRSGDWTRTSRGDSDVFVQLLHTTGAIHTIFWGGTGDEHIGGGHFQSNNHYLYLAGWTDSRDAPLQVADYVPARPRAYAGGATDGFVLIFHWTSLTYATYLGGPGADKLYGVWGPDGLSGGYVAAGETDNTEWAESTVTRFGKTGGTDAFIAKTGAISAELIVLGGSADDRAIGLRLVDNDRFAIAGETESPDFPAGGRYAGATDTWGGLITFKPSQAPVLQFYGGPGNDRLTGVAYSATGIYLAGVTDSRTLPNALNSYGGGDTDGFVAWLDPLTAVPRSSSFIGGSGRDEIAAIEAPGDVLLSGWTDSAALGVNSLENGEGAAGRTDALLVLCDLAATPVRGFRFGGTGDDRAFSVRSTGDGKVMLSGSSDSYDWMNSLERVSPSRGGTDGFVITLAYAAVQAAANVITIGRDLQDAVSISTTAEPGADGLVIARSSDPSKLLLSNSSQTPGAASAVLQDTETGRSLWLQALSDSGDVEVLLEGRTQGTYVPRRIRVTLAPSALFFESSRIKAIAPSNINIETKTAILLPGGQAGPAQNVRPGAVSMVSLISSDPAGLAPLSDSPVLLQSSGFRVEFKLLRTGNYTVSILSSLIQPAPGQVFTVQPVADDRIGRSDFMLAVDHMAEMSLIASSGDQVRLTSSDPSKVLLGVDRNNLGASANIVFTGTNQSIRYYIGAFSSEGVVAIRVQGTISGAAIDTEMRVYLASYVASIEAPSPTIAAGSQGSFAVALNWVKPKEANGIDPPFSSSTLPGFRLPVQPRSSDASVIRIDPAPVNARLGIYFTALRTGSAVIDFDGDRPEFASARVRIDVVTPVIGVNRSEIPVPIGAQSGLMITANFRLDLTSRLRIHLSEGSPFVLSIGGERGTDLSVQASAIFNYYLQVSAKDARPGQEARLYIEAPNGVSSSATVRAVEFVLIPNVEELRLKTGSNYAIEYEAAGLENGRLSDMRGITTFIDTNKTLSVVAGPPGVCDVPSEIRLGSTSRAAALNLKCLNPGETTIRLTPVPGISDAQASFTTRVVVSTPNVPPVLSPTARIITGKGVETSFGLYVSGYRWTGAVSNDPSRVLLSLDPKTPGSARVSFTNGSDGVWVQGFAAEGSTSITYEAEDGRRVEIPVYLMPATFALRPVSTSSFGDDPSGTVSLEHPRSQLELSLEASPFLVEAQTGRLLRQERLAVRGGTDPAFVRGRSSMPSVLEPSADGVISEGDSSTRLKFRTNGTGEAVLQVSQPEGFISVPDSALRVKVVERELNLYGTLLVAPDMQIQTRVTTSVSNEINSTVTITSLDPAKIVLSQSSSQPGQASVAVSIGSPIYIQALGNAPAGKVKVRMEAAGYATSELEIEIAAAVLEMQPAGTARVAAGANTAAYLVYGPIDRFTGSVSRTAALTFRPGVSFQIDVESSDPSILKLESSRLELAPSTPVKFQALRPGTAEIRIRVPEGIVSRVAAIPVVVAPFRFYVSETDPATPYLVSRIVVRNPLQEPVSATVASSGATPVRIGTAASGPGAPFNANLSVRLNGGEERTLYIEPTQPGASAEVTVRAPDFDDYKLYLSLRNPQVAFTTASPLSANLASGSIPLTLRLSPESGRELPLGQVYGPLSVELKSSNPQVVRVTSPIVFQPGVGSLTTSLELVGKGDAVVTLVSPKGFNNGSPTRDLIVTVR